MKRNKKSLALLLTITLIMSLFQISVNAETTVEGNIFIHSTSSDFDGGTFDGVKSSNIGDGAIVLNDGNSKGTYTSEIINTSPFEYLVLSWDSDTPPGTSVEIEARVNANILDSNGQWTEKWSGWLSWGTWGTYIKRASGTGVTDDPVAYVDTDTLVVKGSSGETANKIQYKVTLNGNLNEQSPSIRLMSGAIRNTLPNQGITKVFAKDSTPDLTNLNKTIDVPQFSQVIRDPSIAGSICSATSTAMILNYYGINILPEESAWGVYDYSYDGFGNWPFNTAFASSFGLKSYVDYSTIEGLKREIYYNHPVAVSVKYRNSTSSKTDLPLIDNAPIESTYGHLIVVCGFKNIDGTDYVVVNDPAASNNEGVRLNYKLDQFTQAWAQSGNIAYIIQDKEPGAGYGTPALQLAANLVDTSGKQKEYKLVCGEDAIDISSNNVKTIMLTSDGGKTYQYIAPSKKATIVIKSSKKNTSTATVRYIFITGEGKSYSAELK